MVCAADRAGGCFTVTSYRFELRVFLLQDEVEFVVVHELAPWSTELSIESIAVITPSEAPKVWENGAGMKMAEKLPAVAPRVTPRDSRSM